MRADELRKILKAKPFEPVRLGLTDGRSVLIYHPDQVVVSERKVFVGLAKVARSRPLATPKSGDTIAKDWLWVDVLHVATIEPVDGNRKKPTRRRRK